MDKISAFILAGGMGTRLRAIVEDKPKPLAEINGNPFLSFLLDYLESFGIQHVVLCVGYKAEMIQKHYGTTYKSITIDYSIEESPLGTAGALRLAYPLSLSEEILILNGDSFFYTDISTFLDMHVQYQSITSVLLREVVDISRYGSVQIDINNKICSFNEKVVSHTQGLINAGIYITSKKTLQELSTTSPLSLELDCFPKWVNTMYGIVQTGKFIDIGTPESYKEAQWFFKEVDLFSHKHPLEEHNYDNV